MIFRVYFNYECEYLCKATDAKNPDEARKNVKRDYPGAVIRKIKRDRGTDE